MTVLEILAEIVSDTVSELESTDTRMLGYFKSALRMMPVFLKDRLFVAEDTLTVTAGNNSVSLAGLDPTFLSERSIWWVGSNSERNPIVRATSMRNFNENFQPSGRGDPAYYHISGNTIYFDKGMAATKTIGFDYFKAISAVAVGDTFYGNEQHVELAKLLCKAQYYRQYEEDEAKAAAQEATAGPIILQLQGEYEAQELGDRVEEHTDF